MKYFLTVSLLALTSAIAQEPGKPATAANSEPEIRRATAAYPGPDEPEVRRAIPANPTDPEEIPIRRAVAVSPAATPAAANSAANASQTNSRIPTEVQQRAQTEISDRPYSTPSPTISHSANSLQLQNEGIQAEGQSPEHQPADSVAAVGWIVAFVISLFTAIMLAICLKKDIFLFLNKWDIALSLMTPIILIFSLLAAVDGDLILRLLIFSIVATAILGGLFTGWKTTGSVALSLLLFIPKMIVIYATIVFGVLSALLATSAAQLFKDGKTSDAAKSAALAAGAGVGAMKMKTLIDRLTRD